MKIRQVRNIVGFAVCTVAITAAILGTGFFKGLRYAENTIIEGGQYVNGTPQDEYGGRGNRPLIDGSARAYCSIVEKAGGDVPEVCSRIPPLKSLPELGAKE